MGIKRNTIFVLHKNKGKYEMRIIYNLLFLM